MANDTTSLNWPLDDRDELTRLARMLSQAHFDTQVALVKFHVDAEVGHSVPDAVYKELFVAIGRLQLASVTLKAALVAFRTTARLRAVRPEGES